MYKRGYSVGTSQKTILSLFGDQFTNIPMKVKKADILSHLNEDGILECGTLMTSKGKVATTSLTGGTAGVYTLTISTAFADGESVTINGSTYTAKTEVEDATTQFAVGTSATTQATALKALLTSDDFAIANTGATITFTQKVNGVGAIPVVSTTSTTGAASITETTAGVNPTSATTDAYGILYEDIDFNDSLGEETASICIFGFVNPKTVKFSESSVGKTAELAKLKMIMEVEV